MAEPLATDAHAYYSAGLGGAEPLVAAMPFSVDDA